VRPSRSILAFAIIASVPATALGLLAAPGPSAAAASPVHAPVATPPQVVADAAVAPKHSVAKPTATAVHHAAAPAHRTTTARRPTVTASAPKPSDKAAAKPVAKPAPKPTTAPAVHTGNDYPYAGATTNANDKWGFTERQCVSFTAWRLARNGHPLDNGTQNWGSALHWDEAARAHSVSISATPHVGAIAQWNASESSTVWVGGGQGRFTAGGYGHVGYVAAVYSDGSALIEQYNAQGDRNYSVMRMTAPRYLF
jgi:surface antigen